MVQYYFDPKILTDTQMDNITSKIAKFSQNNDNDACVLWTRSCNGSGYPQLRLGKELEKYFGDRCYNPGHILFSLHHNRILAEHGMEMLHLCHNKKCISIVHFSYEPKIINNNRKTCNDKLVPEKKCFGHGTYPNCIF